jgi:N-alpha-acetyltransferase 15/16, NatA auxiliary subunit
MVSFFVESLDAFIYQIVCQYLFVDRSFLGAVVKHFNDFQEDQFDFHSYCLRKVTLRAYVSVLRFEDVVYGQEYFYRAAAGIVRIYLHLNDIPTSNESEEPDYSKMDAAERKKAKAVARKKKKALEKKETVSSTQEHDIAQNGNQKPNQKGKVDIIDEDPLGLEYLKKDHLEEAKKYSSMLAKFAPQNLETWILQYDLAVRRKKPMLALQALFKARNIDPESSELFSRIVDFTGKVEHFGEVSSAVRSVIAAEAPDLVGHQSVSDFVVMSAERIRENSLIDLPMRTAVVKALVDLNSQPIKNVVSLIVDTGMNARKCSIEACRHALELLHILGDEASDSAKSWEEQIAIRFPVIKEKEIAIIKD